MYAPCLWKPSCDIDIPTSCRRPAHSTSFASVASGDAAARLVERGCEIADSNGLRPVDPVARDEALDRGGTHVLVDRAPEEVVEDAEAERAADGIDALDLELRDGGGHDRVARPASTGARSPLSAFSLRRVTWPASCRWRREPREADGRDASAREAVLLEDVGERHRGAGRAVGLVPGAGAERARDGFDFERATVSAASSAASVIVPSRKNRCVMPTQPIASDSRRSGSKPRPRMNSVDPPPMSITSRGRVERRELVRDAEEREPAFLVTADDVDREPQRALGQRDELLRIPRHAKCIRGHDAHRRGMESREAVRESGRDRRARPSSPAA